MQIPEGLSAAISKSLAERIPKLGTVLVIVEPKVYSEGDESLRVRLIVKRRMADREQFREGLLRVIDDTRLWLALNNDSRFPYFEVVSEDEEKELETERRRER